jgi:hypothetical protein
MKLLALSIGQPCTWLVCKPGEFDPGGRFVNFGDPPIATKR